MFPKKQGSTWGWLKRPPPFQFSFQAKRASSCSLLTCDSQRHVFHVLHAKDSSMYHLSSSALGEEQRDLVCTPFLASPSFEGCKLMLHGITQNEACRQSWWCEWRRGGAGDRLVHPLCPSRPADGPAAGKEAVVALLTLSPIKAQKCRKGSNFSCCQKNWSGTALQETTTKQRLTGCNYFSDVLKLFLSRCSNFIHVSNVLHNPRLAWKLNFGLYWYFLNPNSSCSHWGSWESFDCSWSTPVVWSEEPWNPRQALSRSSLKFRPCCVLLKPPTWQGILPMVYTASQETPICFQDNFRSETD